MKVLILITKSNWGGAQRYVYDLATNLPKDRFEVEVMAGGNGVLIDKLKEAGINASGLPVGRDIKILGDAKVFFKLISILRKNRPDVLHVNSSKIGGLGALAGRITGVPNIIFTAHGWAFNENRSFVSKMIIKILHWVTILLSHRTLSVSDALYTQMMRWPFVFEKITVIHNGIKPEPVFSKVNARSELGKINPQFGDLLKAHKNLLVIGSVGELHHIKGYDYAFRAINEIVGRHQDKKIVYVIFGTGEEKEHLERMIRELKIEASIILFGYVQHASQYLKAFDIFLLPSLSEAFPYIGLEAGLAGLPIVASAVGGIPEIIEDMHSGILIQPRKHREISHALEFYMSNKKIQKEHSLAINKKVLSEFSIEQMMMGTIDLYTKSTADR